MRVTLDLDAGKCLVESDGEKFYGGGWGDGESQLLHHVKLTLNSQGYDFIKKRMWKDGHMVDEHQQYLRERNQKGRCLAIYNTSWAIRGANVPFNRQGKVKLAVVDIALEESA